MVHYQSRAQVPAPCVGKPRRPPVLQVSAVQYARPGGGGEGRPPRRPLALSLQHLRGLGGRRRLGLGEKAPSSGSRSGQKAVGGDLSCCLAGRREEGDHRLESQEGS